jgi:DNA-binding NtrC family response regulator
VENAVAAMRNGAYDFLTKPVDLDHLSLLVKRALQSRELLLKHRRLEEELEHQKHFKTMVGTSAPMRQVFDTINRAAPSKASILITGESGVGKELVADAIHELSPRKAKPLIKVHCAALAASILESELFGHEKGAYTGAVSRTRGRFELAHEGTLFLDEIGEIDQNIQIKLLRVLQEKKFERVGGEETIEVDVRIVAATNKDLKEEIEKGTFREDLYYRLNVVNILVPPLRERKDDLPLLISAFLKEFAAENGKTLEGIDDKARAALYAYDWPGNVRELRNCMESAVVMTRGPVITAEDLPPTVRTQNDSGWIRIPLGATLEDAEKIIIRDTLSAHQGNKSKAAEVLAVGRKTLHRKLTEWGEDGAFRENGGER